MSDLNKLINMINLPRARVAYTAGSNPSIKTCRTNVVSKDALRKVQLEVLHQLSEFLSYTFGPMGSNTKLIKGNDDQSIVSEYSKDGHKVLKNIKFSDPIEMSIKAELVDITHHVEREIGDGTTSAVILAANIFEYVYGIMGTNPNIPPYQIIYTFKSVVEAIQNEIIIQKKDVTLDDIYDICMISTNGNVEIANNIKSIYENYGFDTHIDVSVSTTNNNMIKIYDGLTVSEGYSDPAYINNVSKGTAEIHNPNVYAFMDPVDTMDMISLFEKIIITNIIEPINTGESCIPTVILCPKMTRDMSSMMTQVIEILHQCKANQKPPLLVITDISGSDEAIALDIARLCGCKYIKKYIDPEIRKADEAKGLAPTIENVAEQFAGSCELVVSDIAKTKFINPSVMYTVDEEGNRTYSAEYKGLVNFLQSELDHAKENGEDLKSIGMKRKRLRSLQSNMVEYLVGGISIADRDSTKDLVEDAVKNCASAIINGVGNAANFEGFNAAQRVALSLCMNDVSSLDSQLSCAIFMSYFKTMELLYKTIIPDSDEVKDKIYESFTEGHPIDLRTGEISEHVKTSIMTDVKILEAISKIITIMVTSNQCLLQAPQLNTYTD